MSADIERLRKEFRGNQFADVLSLLRVAARMAEEKGAPKHFSDGLKPQETTAAEKLVLREKFTRREKEVLKNDGAIIYHLRGETIQLQSEAQSKKGKPSFSYI